MNRSHVKQKSAHKRKSNQNHGANSLDSNKFDASGIAQLQSLMGNKAALSMIQAQLSPESSTSDHTPVMQTKILKSVPQWVQEQYKTNNQFRGLDGASLQRYLGMTDGGISDAGSFDDDYNTTIKNPGSSNMQHKMESLRGEFDPIIYSDPVKASKLVKRLGSLINGAQARLSEGNQDKESVDYYLHNSASAVEDKPIQQIVFGGSRGRSGYNPNTTHLHVGGNAQDNLLFGFKDGVLHILGRVDFHIDGSISAAKKKRVDDIEALYSDGAGSFTKNTISKK